MQFIRTLTLLLLSLVLLSLRPGTIGHLQNLAASPTVRTAVPRPTWVTHEPVATAATEQLSEASAGTIHLLSDQQVRVIGPTTERYHRQVEQIVSQPGIENASQLELEFDPTYQQLALHSLSLRRGTTTIDALKTSDIKLVQQEDQIEERLFNGTLTALIILKDVRVGDVIEYDYSVNGENPILKGRFADVNYLIEGSPVVRLRYRLLWPTARPLQQQVRNLELKPLTKQLGDYTEYIWERTNVSPPGDDETETDTASTQYPLLHLSEFKSWAEVVNWALPLYEVQNRGGAKLQQHIEQWRLSHTDQAQQLLAALRFVQDEIRYLGIELGPHSHQPHQPELVLERRYGDCKDKSLMLVTALNALGIEAWPVLVNTEMLADTGSLPPSPYAFDHVIVQAQLRGQTYWFDPTSSLERGGLKDRLNPAFGSGLVVRPKTAELEPIPVIATDPKDEPLKVVQQIYALQADNTATLEVVTQYRGTEANAMREYFATSPLREISKNRLAAYTDHDRSVTAEGKPQIQDDEANNRITLTERYQIGRFWKDDQRTFTADRITQELPVISAERKAPLQLTLPLDIVHKIEVRGTTTSVKHKTISLNHEAFAFQAERKREAGSIKLEYRLRGLASTIKPAQFATLTTLVEQIEDNSTFVLRNQADLFPDLSLTTRTIVGLLALSLIPLLLIITWVWLLQPRRLAASFATLPVVANASDEQSSTSSTTMTMHSGTMHSGTPPSGASHAEAIPVQSESALQAVLSGQRCQCGATFTHAGPREPLLYDGARLIFMPLHCGACAQTRELYFKAVPLTDRETSFTPTNESTAAPN